MESSLSSPDSVESQRRESPTRSSPPSPVALGLRSPSSSGVPVAEPNLPPEARGKAVLFLDDGLASCKPARQRRTHLCALSGQTSRWRGGAWEEVRRCRSWRRRNLPSPRPAPVLRPVPRDVVGLCFNCFAADHVAAAVACRNPTRCFRCKGVGHTAVRCKKQPSPSNPGPRRPPPALDLRNVLRSRPRGATTSAHSTSPVAFPAATPASTCCSCPTTNDPSNLSKPGPLRSSKRNGPPPTALWGHRQ